MFEKTPEDMALIAEQIQGEVLEDIAMGYASQTIPNEDLYPHGCNCPYQHLELICSRKDMGHAEYVNEYQCEMCGAKTTNSHPFIMDETYIE